MYAPRVESARTRKRYDLGEYEATLLDQVRSAGSVEYEFIMPVFRKGEDQPFLLVAAEKNDPAGADELLKELGIDAADLAPASDAAEGSHFLCLFDGEGHANLGSSNDWGDADKFEAEALRIVAEKLGEGADAVGTPADEESSGPDGSVFQQSPRPNWIARFYRRVKAIFIKG
jgi:hypothetical protein